nr:very short patch repair endonuclease [Mesorhizobium sp. LSJC264A00]
MSPQRSAIMRAVKHRDTKPEMAVRRALHRLGLRFRLQRRDLPGRPDIVLPGRRLAIFVHGCFWHRHPDCRRATTPKTRIDFWSAKLEANAARDERVERELVAAGWKVLIVWECQTKKPEDLTGALLAGLAALGISSPRSPRSQGTQTTRIEP